LNATTWLADNASLVLNMTLSGILGYTLAAGTYLSIFSHGALRQLMNEGVYWTKTVTFTIDSSFEIIESTIGFIWIAFGISGWANKYNFHFILFK